MPSGLVAQDGSHNEASPPGQSPRQNQAICVAPSTSSVQKSGVPTRRSAAVGLEANLAARTRRAVSPVTVRGPALEPGFVLRGHSAGHPGRRMTGWSL